MNNEKQMKIMKIMNNIGLEVKREPGRILIPS